jgi:predicted RecA/RadA family phage recombinase
MSQANRLHEGKTIKYTPSAAVVAGTVVVANSLVGVPPTDIAANGLGSLDPAGLFSVVKANGTMDFGNPLFWDADGNPEGGVAGTGCLTTTATGNTFFGLCARDAAADDERVVVYKVPSAVTVENSLGTVRADPGNAGAIPADYSGSVQIVTAAGETRTLANPAFVGQMLAISMKTDAGDCVIAVAAAFNQTGNNRITLNDAGDTVVLVGIESGANKRWRVMVNDGATLSTV